MGSETRNTAQVEVNSAAGRQEGSGRRGVSAMQGGGRDGEVETGTREGAGYSTGFSPGVCARAALLPSLDLVGSG